MTKPRWQVICLLYGLLNSLNPLLRPTIQEKKKKKKERKNNVPDHPRAPLGMYNQSSVVFMSAKATSIW